PLAFVCEETSISIGDSSQGLAFAALPMAIVKENSSLVGGSSSMAIEAPVWLSGDESSKEKCACVSFPGSLPLCVRYALKRLADTPRHDASCVRFVPGEAWNSSDPVLGSPVSMVLGGIPT